MYETEIVSHLVAWDILKKFTVGIASARDKKKKGKELISEDEKMYNDYIETVNQNTDSKQARQMRLKIIDGLLRTLFETKDSKRLFSKEQRWLLWHTSDDKVCSVCNTKLSWDDFTIDHKIPHSLNGKTDLDNADLMCHGCNATKGNRI